MWHRDTLFLSHSGATKIIRPFFLYFWAKNRIITTKVGCVFFFIFEAIHSHTPTLNLDALIPLLTPMVLPSRSGSYMAFSSLMTGMTEPHWQRAVLDERAAEITHVLPAYLLVSKQDISKPPVIVRFRSSSTRTCELEERFEGHSEAYEAVNAQNDHLEFASLA